MPYVNVRILAGATTAQKRAVVADITRSLIERLGKAPEHIHVVIDEIDPVNWGYHGQLTSELAPGGRERRSARGIRRRAAS